MPSTRHGWPNRSKKEPIMHVVEVHILVDDQSIPWQSVEDLVRTQMAGDLGFGMSVALVQHVTADNAPKEQGQKTISDLGVMTVLDDDMVDYRFVNTITISEGLLTTLDKRLMLSSLDVDERAEILSTMKDISVDQAKDLIRVYTRAYSEKMDDLVKKGEALLSEDETCPEREN